MFKGILRPAYEERLESIEADLLELYKRSNLLLKSLEESERAMQQMLENQKQLSAMQENLAQTLKQMTH